MYLITHSLLSSWLYSINNEYSDPSEFLLTLNREPTPTNEAMQNGIDFESLVNDIVNGAELFGGKWETAAEKVASRCKGGAWQYTAKKPINVNGTEMLLYGRLDCLKQGEIIDVKFSKKYERGKYFDSTQHPAYLELIPEAERFTYVISNGSEVWTETYRRDETRSIIPVIGDFLNWLEIMGLSDVYRDKWSARR